MLQAPYVPGRSNYIQIEKEEKKLVVKFLETDVVGVRFQAKVSLRSVHGICPHRHPYTRFEFAYLLSIASQLALRRSYLQALFFYTIF